MDSKDHHDANHQDRKPNPSAHCILVSDLPRKTQHSAAVDGTTLLLISREKTQSKISSSRVPQSLTAIMASKATGSRRKAVVFHVPLML